jgi:hypothetical protein
MYTLKKKSTIRRNGILTDLAVASFNISWWLSPARPLRYSHQRDDDSHVLVVLKKFACRYLLYLPISYISAERVEYRKDTFASASSEICAPGGSYFGYSVFPGVMLASLMHSPESLFETCNSFC